MASDRAYTLLLNHLHNPTTKLPLQTLQGALAHHLSTLEPSPTPLAATAISAPFFSSQIVDYARLHSLSTAFRHASHLKYRALVQEERKRSRLENLFKQSVLGALDAWVHNVVHGLQGGHPVLRLAACSGLLLGAEDLSRPTKEFGDGVDVKAKGAVEDEGVVALAEVMDAYGNVRGTSGENHLEEWEKEFQPAGQDLLSLALVFASQSFPLISENKLKVLPLAVLARILTSTITTAFKNGTFLSSVSASITLSPGPEHQVHISPTSAFAQTLESIATSPLTSGIASISRFTSNVLGLLLEKDVSAVHQCLAALQAVTQAVERDWISTSLASVTDAGIAPDSKELATSVWTILKTLLFTVIMVSDGPLSAAIFLPPPLPSSPQSPVTLTDGASAAPTAALALTTLHSLAHLSFVISQFGGVTSTGGGFEELKKTFYLCLDILAADADGTAAEAYVRQMCVGLSSQRREGNVTFRQAKQAFTLASIEQLVPVLSDTCIKDWVWDVCYPHLSDPSNRETFESAHSVILAIFASHAAQQQLLHGRAEGDFCEDDGAASSISQTVARKFNELRSGRGLRLRERATGTNTANASAISGDGVATTLGASGPLPKAEMNAAAGGATAISPVGGGSKHKLSRRKGLSTEFVQRMIPFYARCLIENSAEGRLHTPQLRMAYSALVRSACACGVTPTVPRTTPSSTSPVASSRDSTLPEDGDESSVAVAQDSVCSGFKKAVDVMKVKRDDDAARYALGWYCVQMLLDALRALAGDSSVDADVDLKGKGKMRGEYTGTPGSARGEGAEDVVERVHRLNLTLVSVISSLPLPLLARVLPGIYSVVVTGSPTPSGEGPKSPERVEHGGDIARRKETVETLFEQILEAVGDREKEYAMRWWYENRIHLVGPGSIASDVAGKKEGEETATQARL